MLFIAMRFVQGGDLREVLQRQGTLSPAQVAEFISPVASALDAAHAAGLVHRDVKPGNILVDTRPGRPDHVYLSDFGVSKGARSSGTLTGTGQFLGTPDYSAPEQIEGGTVDGRTDQYALACVAFQLLTGVLPFQRDTVMAVLMAHMRNPPPSVTSLRDDVSAAVDDVIAKGMAKAPDDRYASCGDFADALREALGLMPYRPASQQTNPPRPPTVRRAAECDRGPPSRKPAPRPVDAPRRRAGPVTTAGRAAPPRAPTPRRRSRPAGRARTAREGDSRHGGGRSTAASPGHGPRAPVPTPPAWTPQGGATGAPRRHRAAPGAEGAPGPGRGRLVSIAAGAVIVVAAGAIPFALLRHGQPSAPRKLRGATTSASSASSTSPTSSDDPDKPGDRTEFGRPRSAASSASTANAAKYSLAGKNLTSAYPGAFISSLAFSPAGATLAVADPGPRAGAGTCLWHVAERRLHHVQDERVRRRVQPSGNRSSRPAASWPSAVRARPPSAASPACGTPRAGRSSASSPTRAARARSPSRSVPTARRWPSATAMAASTCGTPPPARWSPPSPIRSARA